MKFEFQCACDSEESALATAENIIGGGVVQEANEPGWWNVFAIVEDDEK